MLSTPPALQPTADKQMFDGTFATLPNEELRRFGKRFRSSASFREDCTVSAEDFLAALAASKLDLEAPGNKQLLGEFVDSGRVRFGEFLEQVRVAEHHQGRMNERRQSIVDKVFLKFDKTGKGLVQVADLRSAYNAALHPAVRAHRLTEKQASEEFFAHFANASRDGTVSREVPAAHAGVE